MTNLFQPNSTMAMREQTSMSKVGSRQGSTNKLNQISSEIQQVCCLFTIANLFPGNQVAPPKLVKDMYSDVPVPNFGQNFSNGSRMPPAKMFTEIKISFSCLSTILL